ncbi:hypothetical protein DOFOFD_07410 [Acetobacteraceae bacterium EV16P]|uniref:Bacteriophage Mu GpT domain-containing protein n=1 Tax=Sorlinia euscelidii TaxID=3081148 RepID=A0ABU7U4F4_9PROT
MEINIGNINALSTKLSMAFAQQLKTVEPTYTQFSLTVPSTSGENFYPRLAELPGLREWVGDRVIHRLKADAFRIRNKTFEETISISREDLEDEQFGLLMPAVQQLAQNAADLPDKLVYEALETGTSTKGMDGQYFLILIIRRAPRMAALSHIQISASRNQMRGGASLVSLLHHAATEAAHFPAASTFQGHTQNAADGRQCLLRQSFHLGR